jgi:acyl-CoA synthetase (AMP-forming)/AMP-acid ligase II
LPRPRGAYDVALTYAQLDARSDAIAAGLARRRHRARHAHVVMLRPTPEFFLVMFALFKAGAVPVLVDPGIDRRALRQCLDEAQPEAFIGIRWRTARASRWAGRSPRACASPARRSLAGRRHAGAGRARRRRREPRSWPTPRPTMSPRSCSPAAPPACRRASSIGIGISSRRSRCCATRSASQPGGVDLPTFPPFALFDPALGLTSIIPDMDPTRPARADPRRLLRAIERFGVDQLFGSPALMRVLARHGARLPSLRRVTSAGAPVPASVVATMRTLLPAGAQFWTPYGATECLPVAVIEGRELQAARERTEHGAGTCVGRAVPPNVVRIIGIDDAAIAHWDDALLAGAGQVGEITVAGPTATDSYFNREAATRLAKIAETLPDGGERIVHRMGDLGYFDADGRLWFCGRKSQRVVIADGATLCTEQVEPVFDVHPDVRRSALVGVGAHGAQTPVLCVDLHTGVAKARRAAIVDELRQLGDGFVHTAKIGTFLFHSRFPVDIRHNAKIGREALARWAARELRRRRP